MEQTEGILIPSAHRTQQVQEYYFSGKLQQIDQMRRNGANVINLGIGSPDLPPDPTVVEELYQCALNPKNHGYQSYIGTPVLRQAFADWYLKHFRVKLDPACEILPLIGSKEGIMHITLAFVNEGEEVLIPNPGYPAYESVARLAGANIRYYDLNEETGWLPDLNNLETEGLQKVKLMWVNYPHMPTGTPSTDKLFSDLVAFARKNKILICNDNPYSFILNTDTRSILSVDGAMDIALELNSLSKSQNMAGWRIGMLAGRKEYIKNVMKVKSNMDSGMFKPLQAAAAKALQVDESWYRSVNEVYLKRRLVAEKIMNALKCTFDFRQTGLFLWGKIPEHYNGSEELTEKVLDQVHVFLTPGFIFGSNGNRYIRISLCSNEDLLKEALLRIENKLL
ncbi:MAG: aminotransferase [Bacteroidetes bacterium HGW-Bacteroidetes-11]|jgi:aspartate/methionine/tyrosine aminotransferase|nr:MAG: aminotransferase [Bacteroidetes bacterium HGW-Bacteroidetes-11]